MEAMKCLTRGMTMLEPKAADQMATFGRWLKELMDENLRYYMISRQLITPEAFQKEHWRLRDFSVYANGPKFVFWLRYYNLYVVCYVIDDSTKAFVHYGSRKGQSAHLDWTGIKVTLIEKLLERILDKPTGTFAPELGDIELMLVSTFDEEHCPWSSSGSWPYHDCPYKSTNYVGNGVNMWEATAKVKMIGKLQDLLYTIKKDLV